MLFGLSFANVEALSDTCYSPPTNELPHHDIVSTLSLAGGQMLFGFRRIVNLDAQEFMRVVNHVHHVVHVSSNVSHR